MMTYILSLFQVHDKNHADDKEFKDQDCSANRSLEFATQRIRELEMELAQAKVSQVESECQSQNLQHQLSALVAKISNSQPVNSTPATSWKTKWDTVVSTVNNLPAQTIPSFQSHITDITNQLNSFDESK